MRFDKVEKMKPTNGHTALPVGPAVRIAFQIDATRAAFAASSAEGLPESGFDLEAHVQEIERGYLAEALKRAGGVQVKAAELLGMSFRSFRYYVKKYNLR